MLWKKRIIVSCPFLDFRNSFSGILISIEMFARQTFDFSNFCSFIFLFSFRFCFIDSVLRSLWKLLGTFNRSRLVSITFDFGRCKRRSNNKNKNEISKKKNEKRNETHVIRWIFLVFGIRLYISGGAHKTVAKRNWEIQWFQLVDFYCTLESSVWFAKEEKRWF